MHDSSYFRTLSVSDTALLRKGGSACLSQSSAGQKTVPVIKCSIAISSAEYVHAMLTLAGPSVILRLRIAETMLEQYP